MEKLNDFVPNPSQLEALELLKDNTGKFFLARGGRRSGKSVAWSIAVAGRAMLYPGTKHGIFRNTLNTCRQLLFEGTFIEVMELAWPGYLARKDVVINKQNSTITFHNGSVIFFRGLDENRLTRQRGSEYATIWLNECNEVKDYESITVLESSLNQAKPMLDAEGKPVIRNGKPLMIRPKMLFDCNPQFNSDWDALLFKFGVNPVSGVKHKRPGRYRQIKMDSEGNRAHQAEGYLDDLRDSLEGMPGAMSTLILGEWRDNNPDALFRPDMLTERYSVDRDDMARVVIGVDPGGFSERGDKDETGIVVVGLGFDGFAYVLDDMSVKGLPEVWGPEVVKAYDKWEAEMIIAEGNQGGSTLTHTIQTYRRNAPVKIVRAKDGKVSRAMPISMAYHNRKVRHSDYEALKVLEQQMYDFENVVSSRGKSPDRVDALVYALMEILKLGQPVSRPGAVQARASGRFL